MRHGLQIHREHEKEFLSSIAEALRTAAPLILAILAFMLFSDHLH